MKTHLNRGGTVKLIRLWIIALGIMGAGVLALHAAPRGVTQPVVTYNQGLSGYCSTNTPTWALNQVSPTVASAPIDLSATVGMYVQVTCSTQSAAWVNVYFSNVSYSGLTDNLRILSYSLPAGVWALQPTARYVCFVNAINPNGVTGTPSALSGSTTSLNYYTLTP